MSDEIHSGALFACLKFSLDGSLLLAVAEGRIYILDSFEGHLKQKVGRWLARGIWRRLASPMRPSRDRCSFTALQPSPRLSTSAHRPSTRQRAALLRAACWLPPQIINPGVGEGGQALEACLTPDSQYVLSGNPDSTIRAWSVASGQQVAQFSGHAGVPTCLKASGGQGWDFAARSCAPGCLCMLRRVGTHLGN